MIGLRRMSHDDDAEVLRLARGARLGQAESGTYKAEVKATETLLGLR